MTVLRMLPDLPQRDRLGAMPASALRDAFLLKDLFVPGQIRLAYTGLDRLIAGAVVPNQTLRLGTPQELRAAFFHQRRETGIINIGEGGVIEVDGIRSPLDTLDGLYIGRGSREVVFHPSPGAAYYLLSAPAHRDLPLTYVPHGAIQGEQLGDGQNASLRTLYRYIHPGGTASCQLMMGMTRLHPGSVWNTVPPHTHLLRSEIYCYFDLNGGRVFHILGTATESRHVVVADREAVMSPPWSIHCGVGTNNYCFLWGMAGENQEFSDMDPVEWNASS